MRRPQIMSRRRRLVSVLAVVGVLAAGGAAWAYFTSHGSGSGHGSTGSMSTVTLNSVAGNPSTPLYPGGTGDVSLEVNNPNSYAVTLVSVALKTGGTYALHRTDHPPQTALLALYEALATSPPGYRQG